MGVEGEGRAEEDFPVCDLAYWVGGKGVGDCGLRRENKFSFGPAEFEVSMGHPKWRCPVGS